MTLSAFEYSLLSMDSYIRPSIPEINFPAPLGATILASPVEALGFSATAYRLNGEVVIAYRGTSDFFFDPFFGWPVTNGDITGQGADAIRFYTFVRDHFANGDPISLTGHSLGGALAGLVGAIFDEPATIFDPAPFMASATNVHDHAADTEWNDFLELAYGGDVANITPLNTAQMSAYHLEGEILSEHVFGELAAPASQVLSMPHGEELPGIDALGGTRTLHDMGLLAIRLYAHENNLGDDWESAALYIFRAMVAGPGNETATLAGYSDDFAVSVGASRGSPYGALIALVAYSGGANSVDLAGNVALRAFWDDANDLGRAVDLGAADAGALGQLMDVYAGLLARLHIVDERETGILDVDEENAVLSVNVGEEAWSFGEDTSFMNTGRDALSDALGRAAGVADTALLKQLTSTASTYAFALGFSFDGSVEGGTVFVGTVGSDTILGSDGDDVIFSGSGGTGDLIGGGKGSDVLVGSMGADTIHGGYGNDVLLGGGGNDVFDGGNDADYLEGNGGNDTIIVGSGDLAVGGDDDDTFLIDATTGGFDPSSAGIIFGGAGSDTFDISTTGQTSVAFVYLDGLTDVQARLIDPAAMRGELLNLGMNADIIIINPDASDVIRLNGSLVTGAGYGETSNTERPEVESPRHWKISPDMYAGGAEYRPPGHIFFAGEERDLGVPNQLERKTDHDVSYGFGVGPLVYDGDVSSGYARLSVTDRSTYTPNGGEGGGSFATLDFLGWKSGAAGIAISGNGTEYGHESISDVYRVLEWDWDAYPIVDNLHLSLFGDAIYHPGLEGMVVGDYLFTLNVHQESIINVLPTDFYSTAQNGVVLSLEDITSAGPAETLLGGAGDDSLKGGSGDDSVAGGDGDDTIDAGRGGDRIFGDGGNDIIRGGRGPDQIDGGDGDDVYVYARGDGDDVVTTGNGNDIISFISINTTTEVFFSAERYDLRLTVNSGGTILVADGLGGHGISIEDDDENVITASSVAARFMSPNAVFVGTYGSDVMLGGSEDQTFEGGAGDDLFDGGGGADAFHGGEGWDAVGYRRATVGVTVDLTGVTPGTGDAEGDTFVSVEEIIGSSFSDLITVLDQAAYGGAGDDVLIAAGQVGAILFGEGGNDTLVGGEGDDTLDGGAGADSFYGGDGTDIVRYGSWSDLQNYLGLTIDVGNALNSTGDAAGDEFAFVEIIVGSSLGDTIIAGAASVHFEGDYGNDTLVGSIYSDILDGGEGGDLLIGNGGGDLLDGGESWDIVSYVGSALRVVVDLADNSRNAFGASGDVLVSIEGIIGSAFDDELSARDVDTLLNGGDGDDLLTGGAGNDVLIGGAGADILSGGDGYDEVWYSEAASGIRLHTGTVALGTGDAEGDVLTGIESISGTSFNDEITLVADGGAITGWDGDDTLTIIGNGGEVYAGFGNDIVLGSVGDDYLAGDEGNDEVSGGDGADYLSGGSGNDLLTGGSGDDFFVFDPYETGEDIVADFQIHNGSAVGDCITIYDWDGTTTFASLIDGAQQVGDDTVINLAGGSITLYGVALTNLGAQDFAIFI